MADFYFAEVIGLVLVAKMFPEHSLEYVNYDKGQGKKLFFSEQSASRYSKAYL